MTPQFRIGLPHMTFDKKEWRLVVWVNREMVVLKGSSRPDVLNQVWQMGVRLDLGE